MLSQQSVMPAVAGTPRYEKTELWFCTVNSHGGFCHAPPPPQRGQAPALHFPIPSPLDSGLRRNDEWGVYSAGMVRSRTNNGEPVCIRNEAPSALSLAPHCRVGIAERPRTGSDGVDYAAIT